LNTPIQYRNRLHSPQPDGLAGFASKIGALWLFFAASCLSGITHAGPLEQKLIDAAFMGDDEVVQALIAQGADVNARDETGNPVLLIAVRPYSSETVKLLIDNGADVNVTGYLGDTPLLKASFQGLPELVRILLDAGADPNFVQSDGGDTALMNACVFGRREIVELLVERGADISAKDQFGFTPLSIAKKNNHQDIVEYLKDKGAN